MLKPSSRPASPSVRRLEVSGLGVVVSTMSLDADLDKQDQMKASKKNESDNSVEDEHSLIKVYTAPDGPCVFTSILPA
jgi:hypothetical protein